MVLATWDNYVTSLEAAGFFVIYALYVVLAVLPSRLKCCEKIVNMGRDGGAEDTDDRQLPLLKSEVKAPSSSNVRASSNGRSRPESEFASRRSADDAEDIHWSLVRSRVRSRSYVLSKSEVGSRRQSGSIWTRQSASVLPSVPQSPTSDGYGNAIETADVEDHLEEMFRSPQDTFLTRFAFGVQLPFTLARHLTVPAANWNQTRRLLASVCPVVGLQMMLLSFGGWDAYSSTVSGAPLWAVLVLAGTGFGAITYVCSTPERQPSFFLALLLASIVFNIAWFNLLANECVALLETLGVTFNISSAIIGMTVLAWGNSTPDLVADTTVAKLGKSKMAIAGCFGSPLLSNLLGLGTAFSLYTTQKGPIHATLNLQSKVAVVLLLLNLAMIIAAFALYRFACPRRFSTVLFCTYSVLLITAVSLEVTKDD